MMIMLRLIRVLRSTERAGTSSSRAASLALLCCLAFSVEGALALPGAAVEEGGPVQGAASPPVDSEVRFTIVPEFSFIERSGQVLSLDDLLGAPWIAIPFYARCMGPCPSMTGDLRAQVYPLLAGSDVRMVSFSVDPDYYTPEVLGEWAARFKVEDERWVFLTGDSSEMENFVRQGLKVALARSGDPALEPGLAITHATRLPVIDPEGRIAGWYECAGDDLSREELVGNMVLMAERALALGESFGAKSSASILPLVNASLNGIAGILLVAGLIAIKSGRKQRHAALMKSAFLVSAAFLVSYVYYHTMVLPLQGGPTEFHGKWAAKVAYLVLLGTHVLLAAVNLPMVLRTILLAQREDWVRHRWWARLTYPIWLYVSVTGVLVYFVLYHWNPTP